jgi:nickel-dependent lactate racemase
MQVISVPQLRWYNPRPLELELPDYWQVQICHMNGWNRPSLKPEQIKQALNKPVDTYTVKALAKGKRDVAIIFDDHTRITNPAPIIPFILEDLEDAGIEDNHIRFISGLGMHGAMTRSDFISKLGESVVSRYSCYNHNPFDKGTFVGTTALFKTPVYVNEEVMECDLKIAITGCVPHPRAGFGGGGKIVLPGITSFETIKFHHNFRGTSLIKSQGSANPIMGAVENNEFREDIDQAGDLAKIDFCACAVVNEWGETVSLYTGSLRGSHAEAAKDAKNNYRTPLVTGMDISIINTYGKANEAGIGLGMGISSVSTNGGDAVLIANAPNGQITHYLSGPFGTNTWARKSAMNLPQNVNNLIIYTEYPHPGANWLKNNDRIVTMTKWQSVIDFLANKAKHEAGTKCCVIPDGSNQYFG